MSSSPFLSYLRNFPVLSATPPLLFCRLMITDFWFAASPLYCYAFFAVPPIYKTPGNAGTFRSVPFPPGFSPYQRNQKDRTGRTGSRAQRALPSSAARAEGLAGSCERASEKAPGKIFERLRPARRLGRPPKAARKKRPESASGSISHRDTDGAGPPQFLPGHFV